MPKEDELKGKASEAGRSGTLAAEGRTARAEADAEKAYCAASITMKAP